MADTHNCSTVLSESASALFARYSARGFSYIFSGGLFYVAVFSTYYLILHRLGEGFDKFL